MNITATETLNLGNNESLSQGVFKQSDGTFLVLTFTKSFSYKTEKAAMKKWASLND